MESAHTKKIVFALVVTVAGVVLAALFVVSYYSLTRSIDEVGGEVDERTESATTSEQALSETGDVSSDGRYQLLTAPLDQESDNGAISTSSDRAFDEKLLLLGTSPVEGEFETDTLSSEERVQLLEAPLDTNYE